MITFLKIQVCPLLLDHACVRHIICFVSRCGFGTIEAHMENKTEKIIQIILILLIIGILAFVYFNKKDQPDTPPPQSTTKSMVKIGDVSLKVDVVKTPEAQARGLGGRILLAQDEGMFFVFEQSAVYTFWMKDMLFAIDIIWIDENGKIVYIKKDARPESYPEAFDPKLEAKYVLEVNTGFTDRHNIKEGDLVLFLP